MKHGSVFTFTIDDLEFSIFGSQFKGKSGDRISKKFKNTVGLS